MVAFVRNRATNVLPFVIGLFLKINGTVSTVLAMLGAVGVSVSERSIERLKENISKEAVTLAVAYAQSGGIFYFPFDNIDIYLRKFQQQLTNKSQMLSVTDPAIIAVGSDGIDVENLKA